MAQKTSNAAKAKPKTSGTKQARKTNSKTTSKTKAVSPAEKSAQKGKNPRAEQEREAPRFFDERTRRDISAVVFALLAIVVFVVAVIPSDALVTSFISNMMHVVFGLGAYILPFVFLIIGASFLIRFEKTHVVARVSVGLTIIFVALLVLLALFTPDATIKIANLFEAEHLVAHGGYIGAGIAWAGLTLFGQVISVIIGIGIIIAGLVIIGLSLSKFVEKLQERRALAQDETTALDSPPYLANIKRQKSSPIYNAAAPTNVLPRGKKPHRATASLGRRSGIPEPAFDDAAFEGAEELYAPQGKNQAITRKLGRKSEKTANGSPKTASSSSASSRQASASTAVLATPNPQVGFELPAMNLLMKSPGKTFGGASAEELKQTAMCLQETLEDFGILASVVGWVAGPTVTLFKVDLPSGVRVSRVTALEDDIALALAAPGVRIFAPIPGTNYVGIEVPNHARKNVLLGDVLAHAPAGPLQIAIGMDVEGEPIISDLAKMPHLLIGGTTGSGKSVSINAMVMSILMRATPAEVRLIMIDPKRVEFTPYNGIPHLYVPVVTEPREAASVLSWGVAEMERRLKVFSGAGARNIGQYNAKVQQGSLAEDQATEMPYIVIVIDELADLMMNVGKEVEYSISRIAQLARAAGIHLIVATQRPSTNVVTGLIKANITNRIAFNVASGIDSRVVLDTPGAENLIGNGDLLLSKPELAKPQRVQGCFVSEEEINAVVECLKNQGEPEYHSEILKTNLITLGSQSVEGGGAGSFGSDDPLIWEAAEIVVSTALGSTSNIQRRLKVGYSRAGRIMDMLEEKGVVGPPNGSKPREVLVDDIELESLKVFEAQDTDGVQSFAEE
ncbi:MAG: DNA translocase FtsK [Eggerthellaceae bacterium]|nr:DNA translocase FtsK [Eggerthellaceae bacterium]